MLLGAISPNISTTTVITAVDAETPPRPSTRTNSTVAMFLALIPGFFSIYGLGHLVLKEWVRGAMFLAMTALYWYMRSSTGNTLLLVVLSIGLFIYQALDLARIIMFRSLRNG